MFGSNENLIFVVIGDWFNSIISLIDDSTGRPDVRWSLEMNEVTSSDIHIVSNLKASVSPGQDMIALANGGSRKQYAKIIMYNTFPYDVESTTMMIDTVTSMGSK